MHPTRTAFTTGAIFSLALSTAMAAPLAAVTPTPTARAAKAEVQMAPPGFVTNGNLCAPDLAIPTLAPDGGHGYVCSPAGGGG